MKDSKKCVFCGSEKVIPNATIVDHHFVDDKQDLTIEIAEKPNALIFKKTKKGILRVNICCSCGKLELFVDNTDELWDTYKKANDENN